MTEFPEILLLLLRSVTLLVVLYAAVSDVRALRIPNWTVLTVLALFAVSVPFTVEAALVSALIGGAVLFVITLLLFFLRVFGGGDAKMIAALGLWLGVSGLATFLLVMSLVGAFLAMLAVVLQKSGYAQKLVNKWKLEKGWLVALGRGESVVPYGVAIAAGSVWAFATI